MDGQDRARLWPHPRLDRNRIEAESNRLHVGENRARSNLGDGAGRREIGEGRNDYLVAWLDAERLKHDRDGRRARRKPDRVRHAARLRQLPLEGVVLRAQDELPGGENPLEVAPQLLRELAVHEAKIDKRNGRLGRRLLHGIATIVRAITTGSRPVRSTFFAMSAAR